MKLGAISALLPLLAAVTAPALAQDNHAAAVQLYDAAEALSKAGRLAEACPKYAESYRLDPQLGALLHQADCLEKIGKLASAYAAFRDAAELAGQKNDERKNVAEARAKALEPRLTRISIDLAPNAKLEKLEISKDGTLVSDASLGLPIAVDRGEHRVEARAPGYKTWQVTVSTLTEGATEHVIVPVLEPLPPEPPPAVVQPAPPPPPPPKESAGVPAAAWIFGGVAVAGLATGVVFNVFARSANADAEARCTNDEDAPTCVVDSEDDAEKRQESLDAASANRIVSYIGFGVGGAAALATVVTLLLPRSNSASPQAALVISPRVSPEGGGVALSGSF